jgi:hypothetical protein
MVRIDCQGPVLTGWFLCIPTSGTRLLAKFLQIVEIVKGLSTFSMWSFGYTSVYEMVGMNIHLTFTQLSITK